MTYTILRRPSGLWVVVDEHGRTVDTYTSERAAKNAKVQLDKPRERPATKPMAVRPYGRQADKSTLG